MVLEGIVKCGQVEGGCGWSCGDLDLHDGAGVRSVTGQDGGCANRTHVRGSQVVIIAGNPGGEGGGGIIVQDQGLTGILREVDDHIGTLGRRQQQGVLVHVAHVKAGRVDDPGDRLVGDDHRGWQEPTFGADLDPFGSSRTPGCVWCRDDVGISLRGCEFCRVEGNLTICQCARVSHVPLQVPEAVIGRIQDAQAVCLGIQRHGWIGRPVHDWRVIELLHTDRDVRRPRDRGGLAERVGLVLPGGWVVQVARYRQGAS